VLFPVIVDIHFCFFKLIKTHIDYVSDLISCDLTVTMEEKYDENFRKAFICVCDVSIVFFPPKSCWFSTNYLLDP